VKRDVLLRYQATEFTMDIHYVTPLSSIIYTHNVNSLYVGITRH
jgi:hypothetical protein